MLAIAPATSDQLSEVLAWLEYEEAESGDGFYCKRDVIEQSFNDGEMYCASCGPTVVGFVIHTVKSIGASIDILEVHPAHRRQGFGRQLALHAIERLFQRGKEFVTARCAPRSSEPFWRTLGFVTLVRTLPQRTDAAVLVLHRPAGPMDRPGERP